MPLKMVKIDDGAGFRAVDNKGKVSATFKVGRTVAGRKVKNLKDARARARAFVQARNLADRRKAGKSAPPAPKKGK